jgi:hypothetical protein
MILVIFYVYAFSFITDRVKLLLFYTVVPTALFHFVIY